MKNSNLAAIALAWLVACLIVWAAVEAARSINLRDFIDDTVIPFANWDGKPAPKPAGEDLHVER